MAIKFLGCPEYESNHESLLRRMISVIKGIMQGKTNNTDTITLTANVATTTVTLAEGRLGTNTVVALMPTTANAGTDFGSGNMYVTKNIINNTFTINHTNAATSDRTFVYALIG